MIRRTSVNGMRIVLGDLNARVGHGLPGEENTIGSSSFGNHRVSDETGSNRALLLELCEAQSLAVTNTFFNVPLEQRATYRHVGVQSQALITERTHLQLDLVLVARPKPWPGPSGPTLLGPPFWAYLFVWLRALGQTGPEPNGPWANGPEASSPNASWIKSSPCARPKGWQTRLPRGTILVGRPHQEIIGRMNR